MKLACIFCGHVRSWRVCSRSILDHVVYATGASVGCATYSTRGYNVHDGRDWDDPAEPILGDFIKSAACVISDVSSVMCEHVEWASACPEVSSWASRQDKLKVPELRLPGVKTAKSLPGAVGMFDCWMRGVDVLRRMEEVCGEFDAVARMRFDLQFMSRPDWNSILKDVGRGMLVSPDFCNFNAKGGCNDQMFIAPRMTWIDAMSISERLKGYCTDEGVELHPETIFGHHLKKIGARVVRHPIDFVIKRSSGGTHDLRRAKG
jgi:hypothetical protein